MAEIFTIVCVNEAVTAAQDVLCAYAATGKKLQLLAVEMAANGQATVGNWPIRLKSIFTVTPGSGGSGVTPENINPDGASPSFTARRQDTTQATGTTIATVASQFNPINGYYWETPRGVPLGDEPKMESTGAFSLSLDGVTGTLNISATMWLREI